VRSFVRQLFPLVSTRRGSSSSGTTLREKRQLVHMRFATCLTLAALFGCDSEVVARPPSTTGGGGVGGDGGMGMGGTGGSAGCPPPSCESGCIPESLAAPRAPEGNLTIGPVATEAFVYWAHSELPTRWELHRVPRCGGTSELVDTGLGYVRALDARADMAVVALRGDFNNDFQPPAALRLFPDGAVPVSVPGV
jgi:hypothetical protein